MRILVSLTLLAFTAGAPFQPQPHPAMMPAMALRVRGGGAISSPIGPELAGKLITGLILTQGAATFLAPKNVAEAYGRKTTPLSEICTASWGAYVLAEGVVSYALLVNKSTVHGALGAGITTITLGDMVRAYLNDFPGKYGMNRIGMIVTILFQAATVHSLLTGQEYAVPLTMALCLYGVVNAVWGALFPTQFATTWGIHEEDIDVGYQHVLRLYSWSLLAFCALTLALLKDVDPLQALAYTGIVELLGLISRNFITKEPTELGMKTGPQYAWMTGVAILVGSILLGKDEVSP